MGSLCQHLQGVQGSEFVLRLRNHGPTVGGAFRHKGCTFRRFRLQPFNTAAQPAIRIVPQRCGGRSMGLPHHSFQQPIQGLSDLVLVGTGHGAMVAAGRAFSWPLWFIESRFISGFSSGF